MKKIFVLAIAIMSVFTSCSGKKENTGGAGTVSAQTSSQGVGSVIIPATGVIPIASIDAWENGNIASAGMEQWFSFTATASRQYIGFKKGTLNDVNVELYDSRGAKRANTINLFDIADTANTSAVFDVTVNETYYIRVIPFSSSDRGSYQIAFSNSSGALQGGGAQITNPIVGKWFHDGSIYEFTSDGKVLFDGNDSGHTYTVSGSIMAIRKDGTKVGEFLLQINNADYISLSDFAGGNESGISPGSYFREE